ncbi:hypothetical protein DSO57_1013856 [Entomophthora muscae]|uniref:Uncharacterized protein n=1 Tax=Entomophthora muscae TaxID=34485 RepID=A0ACC2U497_9FUNG|nr:hypothetical protein DSO57_1013856 [Entomophthora muscae]
MTNTSQPLENTAPNRRSDELPNGCKEIPNISFMSFKSTLVANQDSSPEGNADLKPAPMIMAQEQKNWATFPEISTNKQLVSSGAILLLLNLGVLATQPHISQSYDEPPMENLSTRSPGLPAPPPHSLLTTWFPIWTHLLCRVPMREGFGSHPGGRIHQNSIQCKTGMAAQSSVHKEDT